MVLFPSVFLVCCIVKNCLFNETECLIRPLLRQGGGNDFFALCSEPDLPDIFLQEWIFSFCKNFLQFRFKDFQCLCHNGFFCVFKQSHISGGTNRIMVKFLYKTGADRKTDIILFNDHLQFFYSRCGKRFCFRRSVRLMALA